MQLMHPDQVPVTDHDQLFVYSRRQAMVAALLFVIVTGITTYLLWLKDPWPSYILLAILVLFGLAFRKMLSASFKPENWLLHTMPTRYSSVRENLPSWNSSATSPAAAQKQSTPRRNAPSTGCRGYGAT